MILQLLQNAAASGANVNQIATCRVLLAYLFDNDGDCMG